MGQLSDLSHSFGLVGSAPSLRYSWSVIHLCIRTLIRLPPPISALSDIALRTYFDFSTSVGAVGSSVERTVRQRAENVLLIESAGRRC